MTNPASHDSGQRAGAGGSDAGINGDVTAASVTDPPRSKPSRTRG